MTVEVLTVETVPAYLASRADLAGLVDLSTVTVQEVGDGNLNLVFIVTDAAGGSLVVKQSLPYVRMVGESWPLSQDRILAEARGYDAATRLSPDTIPTYFGLHEERRVIVLEDLSAGTVWRRALNEGRISRGAAAVIGRHVARVGFGTSPFGLDSADYLRALAVSRTPSSSASPSTWSSPTRTATTPTTPGTRRSRPTCSACASRCCSTRSPR